MTSKLTTEELDVLRGVNIYSILGLSNNGRKVSMKCPFHAEKNASFFLYPNGKFYCFGCGKKGNNAIDFAIGLGYTFDEAIEELVKYL